MLLILSLFNRRMKGHRQISDSEKLYIEVGLENPTIIIRLEVEE